MKFKEGDVIRAVIQKLHPPEDPVLYLADVEADTNPDQARVTMDSMSLTLKKEEKEDYDHLVNDAARKIYVFLRWERGLTHVGALEHLEEYAQWGEIPGVPSPLGRGEPVDNEIRALFGLQPLESSKFEENPAHRLVIEGWHSSPTGELGISNPEMSTEGVGYYVALERETAESFGRVVMPASITLFNPLDARGEPSYILHEAEEVMEPSRPGDSEWLSAIKEAVSRSGTTNENWGQNQARLNQALTDVLQERGYDGILIENWAVKFASPEDRADLEGYLKSEGRHGPNSSLCWVIAHSRGNPDGALTAEELRKRIHSNLVAILMMGEECPLKYLTQLYEDLELLAKYEAAGLIPPVEEELVARAS